jgi:ferric-dicitrate binding protein FerR (iron transport regulator)
VFIAILLLAGTNTLQGAGPDAQWLGVLWTKGYVSVGDAKVSSGTTVLPGDVITTAEGASAWLRFRSPASTVLLADTQVALFASGSAPSFLLRRGTVIVDEQVVDPVQVVVPGGYVLVKGDPQTGAECEVAAAGNAATVSVKRGLAEIHTLGAPVILHAGQSARVEADSQGGQPVAGKISKEIPEGVIQRQGQIQELPLELNEVINWNDLVRTLQAGRAQIMLLDGSTLNVGARSTIKILKHDPQAQQTEIEMTLGKVQADVQKITAPGGKFELHTKSAVIGTIDTSYVAETDDKRTRVCGVKGTTTVKSSDPSITKTVKLHKNECAVVYFGSAPTDPVFSPGEVADMLNQTAIQGAAGISTAATAGGLSPTIIGVAAAGGAGAAAAGVVLALSGATTSTTPGGP